MLRSISPDQWLTVDKFLQSKLHHTHTRRITQSRENGRAKQQYVAASAGNEDG